ncbi:hypothetical protein SHL15_2746 [Streptomyces hygroscopicus subsp. limoneus]|nr:hypothetical protein SHL15_2746 [Streptomyces hygroscopicus subsp. limoneus]
MCVEGVTLPERDTTDQWYELLRAGAGRSMPDEVAQRRYPTRPGGRVDRGWLAFVESGTSTRTAAAIARTW